MSEHTEESKLPWDQNTKGGPALTKVSKGNR